MPTSLLSTKLYIPPARAGLLPRPRLVERLHSGMARKLTLVSAPAGFGKSTLLSECVAHCGRSVAWLSLDEGDNDPTRFFRYLVAALQKAREGLGQAAVSLLGSPQLPPAESPMTALINDIAATAEPFVLVLDDYQTIHLDWIHEGMEFLVNNQPPQMHLMLSTRQDPPLPLPRLRVRGELVEIRVEDLRFTADEAAAFLNRALGLALDPEVVAALEARTEGWIAGLQLAALALQPLAARQGPQERTPDGVAQFVQAFGGSHRHVIDYLAEEVLGQQPGEIQEFLRQTAILDRLTAPLCQAVTGREDAAPLLARLEEANLFLIPLDDRRSWYRYHQLFADFLRTEIDEDEQAVLHGRAARWLAAHDLLPEAIDHALAAGQVEEAAGLIAQAAEETFGHASPGTLLGWLEALPEELVRADGRLATYMGISCFMTGRFGEAASYANAAVGSLSPDALPVSRGRLQSLQAHVALARSAIDPAIAYAREALNSLGEDSPLFRSLTLNILGQALEWKGELAEAAEAYRQGVLAGRQAGDQFGATVVLVNRAFTLNELGRRREALALCRQTFEEAQAEGGWASILVEGIYLAWSLLSYEGDELEAANEQAQRALALCRQANIPDGILWAQYVLALVHLACGETETALEIIGEACRYAARMGLALTHGLRFEALEAQANLRAGRIGAAERWAEMVGSARDATTQRWHEPVQATRARLLLAQKRPEEAQSLLEEIESSYRARGKRRGSITVHLLQGLALQAMGRQGEAVAHVEDAARLAAPEGYARAFLDEGPALATLLKQARHTAPAFVDSLLESLAGIEQGAGIPALVEPLSERETEILRLIAAGRSNPEIAELLYLSLNTVKWHVKNLYGKLQVGNRVEAAARGQELGLI